MSSQITKEELRRLLGAVQTCATPESAESRDVSDEQALLIAKEYRYLFMPDGIERDSEIAVRIVNRRFRER